MDLVPWTDLPAKRLTSDWNFLTLWAFATFFFLHWHTKMAIKVFPTKLSLRVMHASNWNRKKRSESPTTAFHLTWIRNSMVKRGKIDAEKFIRTMPREKCGSICGNRKKKHPWQWDASGERTNQVPHREALLASSFDDKKGWKFLFLEEQTRREIVQVDISTKRLEW